jgi:hypothetical protein
MKKYSVSHNHDTSIKENERVKILHLLYPMINNIPIVIRNLICKECQWSVPTFYRKIRLDKIGNASISNAEREKILDIMMEVLTNLVEEIRSLEEG